MKNKSKYPPKAVKINFTEKLPKLKRRTSRLVENKKIPKIINARIEVEKLLSFHHKGDEQKEINSLGEDGKKIIHKIILEPNNFDYVIRRDAISTLSHYNDVDSILLLSSIITDPNEDEVNIGRALDSIATIGGAGAHKILSQIYSNTKNQYVKNRSLKAIIRCNDAYFIPVLKEVVSKHESDYFRNLAFKQLRSLRIKVSKPIIERLPPKEKRIERDD